METTTCYVVMVERNTGAGIPSVSVHRVFASEAQADECASQRNNSREAYDQSYYWVTDSDFVEV